ncbi:MAG TPA: KEOPS complex subunit Pcc1 [Candidatus Thermoplasmatota archaeon]|jgi:tRNA threonylcarbamoyladenosine modification (KEOPS) complex  Pcc1 subunit|nr:KEOPS complex subunit Pcc1 [Candidatus Thermoplasmatota archaeon]
MLAARLIFDLDSPAQADAVEAALLPELGDDVPGARSSLARAGSSLTLDLQAEDAGALRAALNSYLRWAQTALDVHALARR